MAADAPPPRDCSSGLTLPVHAAGRRSRSSTLLAFTIVGARAALPREARGRPTASARTTSTRWRGSSSRSSPPASPTLVALGARRRTSPAGSGERVLADLRNTLFAPPAAALARLLRAQPHRRDHQPDHERRRGARPARHRRRHEPRPEHAPPRRHGGRPLRPRLAARARDADDRPARWRSRRRGSASARTAPTGASASGSGSSRRRSPRTSPACASCSRSPASRATRRASAAINDRYREANYETVVLNGLYFPAVDLLSSLATAIVLGYGGYLAHPRRGDDRHAARVHALPLELLRPGAAALAALQHVSVRDRRARQDHRACSTRSRRSSTPTARSELPRIDGHVRFDDVRFGYGRAAEVLHGIDLDVPAGTTVALVGHTGAGKSTIAKLLARFYDPREGRITIDGHDLRDVTQAVAAPPARHRAAGGLPLRRHGRREHRLRAARRDREEIERGRRGGRRRRLHPRARERLRHRARRARLPALARPAPARRLRPRAPRRPAHPHPRRGHVVGRHRHRAADRARRCDASSPAARRS